nr:gliding motility protein GldB [Prevotella sp.]
MLVCVACEFKLKPTNTDTHNIEVQRYDRLESRYLTTGDFSALQQMNTDYPIETRTLIEKVLQLGEVNDGNISNKFLMFYQDSVLQTLLSDAEAEYANIDDINKDFTKSFQLLSKWLPGMKCPEIYMQIGALDQSIIVGEHTIGISLDKYMGVNYPLYKKYYSVAQRKTMERSYIVPDCLSFFLIGQYPMKGFEQRSQKERDIHMGKVMFVVNKAVGRQVFKNPYVTEVAQYMKRNKNVTIKELLENDSYVR